ncbi:MAG: prephenate dehydrogenase/arogenate dehydrogenase family protein [Actinomycetota bacterium]
MPDNEVWRPSTICVIGTGLMGGSFGLACKRADPAIEVIGFDIDRRSLEKAVARGAIDRAGVDLASTVHDADLILIAVPSSMVAEVFHKIRSDVPPGAIVTDVGSTKSSIIDAIAESGSEVAFIGGHPIAGSEHEGIDAASEDLFDGADWILTPTDATDAVAYGRLVRLLGSLGVQVLALDPRKHDEAMAVASHLPQVVASALMGFASDLASGGGTPLIAGGGFKDMTRIAASPTEMWVDILKENKFAVATAISGFGERLNELKGLVEEADWDKLRTVLDEARLARRALGAKPGIDVDEMIEIKIPVPDKPGALAEVTTSLGEAGVNIEDLNITHSPEGGRGTISIWVAGEDNARAATHTLVDRGYQPE